MALKTLKSHSKQDINYFGLHCCQALQSFLTSHGSGLDLGGFGCCGIQGRSSLIGLSESWDCVEVSGGMHGWLVLLRRQGPELYNLTTEKDLRTGRNGGKTVWVILAVIG